MPIVCVASKLADLASKRVSPNSRHEFWLDFLKCWTQDWAVSGHGVTPSRPLGWPSQNSRMAEEKLMVAYHYSKSQTLNRADETGVVLAWEETYLAIRCALILGFCMVTCPGVSEW